jgi:hypothetical protein
MSRTRKQKRRAKRDWEDRQDPSVETLWHKIMAKRIDIFATKHEWKPDEVLFVGTKDGLIIDANTEQVVGDWIGSPSMPNEGAKYIPEQREEMAPYRKRKIEKFFALLQAAEEHGQEVASE